MRRAVLVYVGPGGDVIDDSSSGLVVDDHADGSVMLDGRHDEVIDSGHGDHVKCAGSAGHDLIYDTSTDSVAGGCHRHGDRVLPLSRLAPTITAKAGAAAQVTGDGSNANPFIAPALTRRTWTVRWTRSLCAP